MPEHDHANIPTASPLRRQHAAAAVATPAIAAVSLSTPAHRRPPGAVRAAIDESSVQAVSEASPGPHRGVREGLSALLHTSTSCSSLATPRWRSGLAPGIRLPRRSHRVGGAARARPGRQARWSPERPSRARSSASACSRPSGASGCWPARSSSPASSAGAPTVSPRPLVIFAAYSVAFAIRVLSGPPPARHSG